METLPRYQNYKIYFDNWFSSPSLAETLLEYGFHSVSTLRINRAKGLRFSLADKAFSKKPRGFSESMVNSKSNLNIVTWNNSKTVNLLSSFVGVEPLSHCLRFNKVEKRRFRVSCPKIVLEYNQFMSSVDLCDMFMALYRIDRRSKRYCLRIVYYLFTVCCSNAWIIHKKKQETFK